MDKVVHFEIPVDDLERAKTFYGSIFGWELVTTPIGDGEYTLVTTTPVDESRTTESGGINGGMMQRSEVTPYPVITIGVESVDDALKQVEASGGAVVTPKTPIPGMGAFAYFTDTEGNVMGMFEVRA